MHVYVLLIARSRDFFPMLLFHMNERKNILITFLIAKLIPARKLSLNKKSFIGYSNAEKFLVSTVNNANTLNLGKGASPGVFC